MGKEESRETPQDEARSHSSGFLKKAARLATKRKTKKRKMHRGTKSRGGRK